MTARTIAIAIGVTVLVGLAASVDAKRYRAKYAGTSVVTSIDSNDDGVFAREAIGDVKTNLGGRGVNRGVVELTPGVPAEPGECEGLDLGEGVILRQTLVSGETISTFKGSLRFIRVDSLVTCVNATTGVFVGEGEYTLLGGTGRWEGWTGTYTSRYRGQALSPAAPIVGYSGESTGEFTKAK